MAWKGIVLPAVAYAQSKPMTIWTGAASRDPSASSPRPLTTQASPAARRALLACALGWLFDGYETYALILVGAAAIRDLIAPDQLPLYFGSLATVTLLGWATGGVSCGVFADYLRRRRTLMLSIVLYAAFTGLSAVAQCYWMLLAFRFLAGLGLGGEFAPGTTLVAELWTSARRGRAAGALASAFGVGCLLASGLWLLVGGLGHGRGASCSCSAFSPHSCSCGCAGAWRIPRSGRRRIAGGVPHARRPGWAVASARTNGV
jgi:MFS family permease